MSLVIQLKILITNKASNQDKAKTMIFLQHHFHEGLKAEYLTVNDPLVLWNSLKKRYDHQKMIILSKARRTKCTYVYKIIRQ